MNLEILNKTVVGWMRELPNPMSGSTTDIWCYVDYPRNDVNTPRISVSQSSGREMQAAIGDNYSNTLGVFEETNYDLDIWVKQSNSSPILSKAGTQLRDYIGDLVIQKIKNKRSSSIRSVDPTQDIIDIEIMGVVTQPFIDEFEFHRKTITIRITHVLTHT